jgi:hypothetical protein
MMNESVLRDGFRSKEEAAESAEREVNQGF